MYCANCGAELKEGAKFCTVCGTAVDGPVQPQTQIANDTEPVNSAAQSNQTSNKSVIPSTQPAGKESTLDILKNKSVIIGATAVALILIVLIAYNLGKKSDPKNDAVRVEKIPVETVKTPDKQEASTQKATKAEETQDETKNISQEYACLPEMLTSTFEDGCIQIDNSIIHVDGTMTIKDVHDIFEKVGGYSFKATLTGGHGDNPGQKTFIDYNEIETKTIFQKDTNNGYAWFSVYKDGLENPYFTVSGYVHPTKDTYQKDQLFVDTSITNIDLSKEAKQSSWIAYGIRSDGNGLTEEYLSSLVEKFTVKGILQNDESIGCYVNSVNNNIELYVMSSHRVGGYLSRDNDRGTAQFDYVLGRYKLYYSFDRAADKRTFDSVSMKCSTNNIMIATADSLFETPVEPHVDNVEIRLNSDSKLSSLQRFCFAVTNDDDRFALRSCSVVLDYYKEGEDKPFYETFQSVENVPPLSTKYVTFKDYIDLYGFLPSRITFSIAKDMHLYTDPVFEEYTPTFHDCGYAEFITLKDYSITPDAVKVDYTITSCASSVQVPQRCFILLSDGKICCSGRVKDVEQEVLYYSQSMDVSAFLAFDQLAYSPITSANQIIPENGVIRHGTPKLDDDDPGWIWIEDSIPGCFRDNTQQSLNKTDSKGTFDTSSSEEKTESDQKTDIASSETKEDESSNSRELQPRNFKAVVEEFSGEKTVDMCVDDYDKDGKSECFVITTPGEIINDSISDYKCDPGNAWYIDDTGDPQALFFGGGSTAYSFAYTDFLSTGEAVLAACYDFTGFTSSDSVYVIDDGKPVYMGVYTSSFVDDGVFKDGNYKHNGTTEYRYYEYKDGKFVITEQGISSS